MTKSSGAAGDALVAVLRAREGPNADYDRILAGVDENALLKLVETHRLAGLLYSLIEGSEVLSSQTMKHLAGLRRGAWARNMASRNAASIVAEALRSAIGHDWVIVKGPALAEWYGSPHHRSYVDLDLLVPRSRFAAALGALEAAGYPPLTGNWDGFRQHGVAEVPLGSREMVLDLHWHIVALASTRAHFTFDIDAMIDRQGIFETGDQRLPTFDPVDTLLHLCVHGGLSGGSRLVWLLDVDTVVRSGRVDWPTFEARARSSRSAAMSALLLDRTRRVFGTPLPDGLIDRLSVIPGLARLSRMVERSRSDVQRLDGWYSGALIRVGRDRATLMARTLARNAWTEIQLRRGATFLTRDGGDIDWTGPDSGPVGKQRWLEYIASEAP